MATTWDMPAGSGDRWPDDYERGRPGWPAEAVEFLNLPATATVLDLGAGTGKLTRALVERFERVVAVEPADAMRRLLTEHCPRAESIPGDARSILLPDGSIDAVFAAQAFHWFDDDRSTAEIARVLRRGGGLVLLWNLPAGPWEPSAADAEALLLTRLPAGEFDHDPVDLGGPGQGTGPVERSLVAAGFESPGSTTFPNLQTLDREGLVSFYASMGWVADLPDDERLPLLAEVRSLLTEDEYQRRWRTLAYWSRRPAR